MSCKTLGWLAIKSSKLFEFAIVAMQSHPLPGYYLLMNSTDQASDDNHNWNKMVFAKLKH
jgi:hypothetical protein